MEKIQPKAVSIPVSGELAEQLKQNKKLAAQEKERRRIVYSAICELSEQAVTQELLFQKCQVLDIASWNEVVEERFLGRICGLPTCSNKIEVDFRKTYVLDKKRNTIYSTNSEFNKYCSVQCHALSETLRSQLEKTPIWEQAVRPERQFSFPAAVPTIPVAESIANAKHAVPALVARLEEFRLAEHLPTNSAAVSGNEQEGEQHNKSDNSDEDMGVEVGDTLRVIDWIKQKDPKTKKP